ncbi:hypothetical protein Poly30_40870 [Planctomycetes bacterium Poly30]|uniref:Uncharacterized protein n=2 Tax=Saltatorellus ferox TaxID=2528018 RepID=A0A518EWR9_9BACT|nr:hypothetical protein Poly30_40870 [Planctomycetes bacterium Poly30]
MVWIGAALAPLAAGERSAKAVDPKDGPDVDLRIAVEDDEIRFQVITNLAFLDATTAASREDPATLAAAEAPDAMTALFDLFRSENEVTIDGTVVQPIAPDPGRDFEFDPGDPSLFPHFVRYGATAVAKTRLTLRYPCKSPPRRVSVTWGIWPANEQIAVEGRETPSIEILARFAAGGVDRVITLKESEPQYTWHREADAGRNRMAAVPPITENEKPRLPWGAGAGAVLSLLCVLKGPRALRRTLFGPLAVVFTALVALQLSARDVDLPTEAEALAIFEPLHENIYRAFDYTDESAVYDALAQSVDGQLLSALYDDVYRSLVLQEEGGAVAKVTAVRHDRMTVGDIGLVGRQKRVGFRLECQWQVDGAVYHWGHAHTRTNEYIARYTVHAGDDGWRIAASQPIEQRRVDSAPLSDLDMGNENRWRAATSGETTIEEGPREY